MPAASGDESRPAASKPWGELRERLDEATRARPRRRLRLGRRGEGQGPITAHWGIHLTGVRFDVLGHEPVPASARGLRVGELAVNHESGALPGPHRQPSTSDSPANAAAGAWVPAELGAASGEPPVDNHGVGQLRLHGYPRTAHYVNVSRAQMLGSRGARAICFRGQPVARTHAPRGPAGRKTRVGQVRFLMPATNGCRPWLCAIGRWCLPSLVCSTTSPSMRNGILWSGRRVRSGRCACASSPVRLP